jgi:hypothetical protein
MEVIQYTIPVRQCRGSKNWGDMPAEEAQKMVQMQNRWDQHEQKRLEDAFFVPNSSRILLNMTELEDAKDLFGNTSTEDKKLFTMWARMKQI